MAKQEKKTREDILGIGVQGSSLDVKTRIDSLENGIENVNELANQLIVQDAINIMKAHAKLNAIAKTTKYKMHNMFFDDLLDLSGIDTTKSSGYTHDATLGLLKASGSNNYIIETKTEFADSIPSKAILTVEEYLPLTSANLIPIMVSNTSPSGVAISSSSQGNPAYHAFNGSAGGTSWAVLSATGWVGYEFPANQVVNRYTLNPGTNNLSWNPKNWTFQGWDGATWVTLDTRTNQTTWPANVVQVYDFDNDKAFKKYRLNITANNGNSTLYVAELQMMVNRASTVISGNYSISRDNGATWLPITPDSLFYFDDKIGKAEKNLKIKAEFPTDTQLLSYALTWA